MLFDTNAPTQYYNPDKNYSNSPWLKYLGYNSDGTRNDFGKALTYIPSVAGIGTNLAAQGLTQNTDTNPAVKSDFKDSMQKFLIEAGIAASALTAGAAAPAVGAAVGGAGVAGGAIAGEAAGTGAATAGSAIGSAGAIGGAAESAATDSAALPDLGSTGMPNMGQGTGWADVLKKQGMQLAQNIGNSAANQPVYNNQPGSYSLQNYNNIS